MLPVSMMTPARNHRSSRPVNSPNDIGRKVAEGARNAEANRYVCNHRSRHGDERPLRRSCSARTAIRLAAVLPLPVCLLSTYIPEATAVRQHVLSLRAFDANPGLQQKLVQLLSNREAIPQGFTLLSGRVLANNQRQIVSCSSGITAPYVTHENEAQLIFATSVTRALEFLTHLNVPLIPKPVVVDAGRRPLKRQARQ